MPVRGVYKNGYQNIAVAKEQNFTKAAEQLNITQPTLSRQLSALEDEIGKALFIRGNRSVTLTETGILLKRRALEILDLEEKMMDELMAKEELIEGTITIGCGEFAAVETLAEICKVYKEKYPMVQIALHTATADSVYDMMNQGLVDIGLYGTDQYRRPGLYQNSGQRSLGCWDETR